MVVLKFGSPTWARTRDLRINSPSLYRLSYRGSEDMIIGGFLKKASPSRGRCKKTRFGVKDWTTGNDQAPCFSTWAMALATCSMFFWLRAATQMRPLLTA